jgi:hypothetical protein
MSCAGDSRNFVAVAASCMCHASLAFESANFAFSEAALIYTLTVFVRLGHALLIVAFLAATGGHWAVLQTVAWTNMLADNLQTTSLSNALTKTFDGKHPCTMCKEISAGKKSEKKAEFPTLGTKLEFVSERPAFVFSAPSDFRLVTALTVTLTTWSEAPPTPPPLAA